MNYLLNKPSISKKEIKYVNQVMKEEWLSSNGKHTQIFERKIANFFKLKFAIAVQSGTAGLHVALKAAGIKKNDKVIIPNYTCSSNISAVSQCNAVPVIVEIEEDTLGLDFKLVKTAIKKYRPKALQLVHVYGFPARDTKKIVDYCKKNKVIVIEDISESLGAKFLNKLTGTFGDITVLSVRSEKMIGVGEGGVILTNSDKIYKKILLFSSRCSPFRGSRDPYWKKYFVDGEGYNYLMPHLLGAVGRAQIERFQKEILPKKIKVGILYRKYKYEKKFKFTQKILKNSQPVYWLNSICFPELSKEKIRNIAQNLIKKKIEVRPGFWPMNMLNFKSYYVGEKKISKYIFEKTLILPSNYLLKKGDVNYILKIIKKITKK